MGRILQGNPTTVAKTTKLTQRLGSTSSSTVDTATKATGTYGGFTFSTLAIAAIRKNTAREQQNPASGSPFILQDEAAAYNAITAYSTANQWKMWLFDDDLNVLDVIATVHPSFQLSVAAVRLYNGKIYYVGANASYIRVGEYDIATKTYTNYDWAHGLPTTPSIAVFNWPVNGQFYISYWMTTGGASNVGVVAFDLTSKAFATPFPVWAGTASNYLGTFYVSHVKDDGSALSIAAYNGGTSQYGVWKFDAGTASFTGQSSSGQAYYSRANNWAAWTTQNSLFVTKDCVIDSSALFTGTNGSTYYTWVSHLRGGDVSVIGQEFTGANSNQYPVQSMYLMPTRHNINQVEMTYNGTAGMVSLTRSGNTLVLAYLRASVPFSLTHVPCQLAGTYAGVYYAGADGSAYLSQVAVRTDAGRSAWWSFHALISNSINGIQYNPAGAHNTSFVTRKGKLFGLGYDYTTGSNTTAVTTQIPYLAQVQQVTYNVSVVGAGGSSVTTSPVHGTSSSIAGIAAAAGQTRTGGRSGSQVVTSGPLRGTGGDGYFDEKFGQGEDAGYVGQYGGGSGYLATGTITLAANEVVPYVAGIAPQYGGQGAIVLEEV